MNRSEFYAKLKSVGYSPSEKATLSANDKEAGLSVKKIPARDGLTTDDLGRDDCRVAAVAACLVSSGGNLSDQAVGLNDKLDNIESAIAYAELSGEYVEVSDLMDFAIDTARKESLRKAAQSARIEAATVRQRLLDEARARVEAEKQTEAVAS